MPELISLWCLYNNIWTRSYILLFIWRVRGSRLKEFYKKGVLKYPTKFTGQHLRLVLFRNKAADWRTVTSLNTESGTGAFLWIFWNLYKNIYFANASDGMPLISKIFTGVSFRKMLHFHYKRKRQLFYYGQTLSKTLRIPERVNRVISQNSCELLLVKGPQQTKTCSKLTKKECFRNVLQVSLWLAWRIFLKSDFCKSSGLYINSSDGVLLLAVFS